MAARAVAGAKHEPVRDAAETAQVVQSFAHQIDLVITAHLADGHAAVRIGVKEVWPALQPVNAFRVRRCSAD
jgi:hypothetical protein